MKITRVLFDKSTRIKQLLYNRSCTDRKQMLVCAFALPNEVLASDFQVPY